MTELKDNTSGVIKRQSSDRRVRTERRSVWDRRSVEIRLAPGEFIFKEGDQAERCYVVVSGHVSIVKQIDGGYRQLVAIEKGSLFGEMALIDDSPRSASARAETDVVVREMDQEQLQEYMSRSPEVAIEMMKRLIRYVRTSNKALEVDIFSASSKDTIDSSAKVMKDEGASYRSAMTELASGHPDNQYVIDEFQNPSDALIKRRLPPVIRRTFISILLLFFSFILWASLSIIDVTLSMPGKLSTTVPNIPVQAGESSVVRTVHIAPGQHIRKGDVIATLDPTIGDANYNKMLSEFEQTNEEIKRLEYEKQGVISLGDTNILSKQQRDIFRSRRNEHESQLEAVQIAIKRAKSLVGTSAGQLTIAELTLQETQQQYVKQEHLVKEGVMHKKVLEDASLAVQKARSELNNAKISLTIAKDDKEKAVTEERAYTSGRLKKIHEDLSDVMQTRNGMQEELIKLKHQQENVRITAPVDGVVLEMEKLFNSSIVSSGDVLATLVPTNVPLVVEMDIDPQSISNVVVGHDVSVKLTALPYQKHGDIFATITYLSENTVNLSINGESGVFYRARAEIKDNRLRKVPKDFRLLPGIQVQGDILTGKRRMITYFLYPVIRTLDTSFVEP